MDLIQGLGIVDSGDDRAILNQVQESWIQHKEEKE